MPTIPLKVHVYGFEREKKKAHNFGPAGSEMIKIAVFMFGPFFVVVVVVVGGGAQVRVKKILSELCKCT